MDARLLVLGRVYSVQSSYARALAVGLIRRNNLFERRLEPELIEKWEKALGKQVVASMKAAGKVSPESKAAVDSPNTAKWNTIRQDFRSQDFIALTKVWGGDKLSTEEEASLKAVFAKHPLGQTNFNVWLKQTLRQVQTGAAVEAEARRKQ